MMLIWLIAFLVLLLVEFLTVDLVSIWFSIGALAALISTFITDSVLIQTVVFVVVSIISLIITRPLIKRFKSAEFEPTNMDRVIGKIAEVTEEIRPNKYGKVIIFGTEWMAASESEIAVGTKVVVEKIDGAKLIVRKEGEE